LKDARISQDRTSLAIPTLIVSCDISYRH